MCGPLMKLYEGDSFSEVATLKVSERDIQIFAVSKHWAYCEISLPFEIFPQIYYRCFNVT